MEGSTRTRKIIKPLIALVFVLVAALVMLIYIASVDAFQSYSIFLLDRISSSAEIIEHEIEPLLQAGLPLSQLVGFDVITNPIITSDEVIYDISIIDNEGNLLFQNSKAGYEVQSLDTHRFDQQMENKGHAIFQTADELQVRVPLDARFDQPGTLVLTMPVDVVSQFINSRLVLIMFFAIFVVIVYAAVLLYMIRRRSSSALLVNIIYNISVAVVAIALVVILVRIYSDGVQQKAQALADSLAVRLGLIFDLGLEIDDFEGIDEVLTDYKRLNPDIDFVSLTREDIVIFHTDPEELGNRYEEPAGMIEHTRALDPESRLAIAVAIPQDVVFNRLIRNIKNFSVLFLASAFLAWLLLRILFSVYGDIHTELIAKDRSRQVEARNALLDIIFPAFFLANFAEALHYSYLPQFLSQLAVDSGFATQRVGGLYALYWAMYALVLIPAGRSARTINGIRYLLVTGFTFIATSMVLIIVLQDFRWMYLQRAIAGLGQGMVFIAVQSYILHTCDTERRTEGVAIIVYGYNGGVISGTVIGALLISSLGFNRLFLISATIAIFMIWYCLTIIGRAKEPAMQARIEEPTLSANTTRQSLYKYGEGSGLAIKRGLLHNLRLLFTDIEFAKTILFVGLITKAVLAGVIFLALPTFLTRLNYRQDDIGQILMFYAAGVLLVSRLVARYTDRLGHTRRILFLGTISSAVGLFIIASAQRAIIAQSTLLQTLVLIGGILIVGLSHGFIHAPIVTHITQARVNEMLGSTVVASIYRFMERIGHVLGPLIFGQLLLQASSGINSIYYIALTVAIFSLLFYFLPSRVTSASPAREGESGE